MSYQTRQVRSSDMEILLGWMHELNWPVSINILQSCYELDRSGWIVAEDSNGEVIGNY